MAKYDEASKLSPEEFRRLTGVKPKTFQEMVDLLKEAEKKRKPKEEKPIS